MNPDPSNWMSASLPDLGGVPLARLVMPASHDSGMYVTADCTPDITILRRGPYGANACNTRTQIQDIAGQLASGSRYFDIRPVLYDGQTYTGHYALGSPVTLGCNGPTLQDYFAQVAGFMAGSGDLVILKFSHYYVRAARGDDAAQDAAGHGFDADQMAALVAGVKAALGGWLCTGPVPEGGLIAQTLDGFIGGGGRVLAVFDALPEDLRDPGAGIYSYADAPGAGDLVVFDQYADKNNVAAMAADQLGKLTDPANHQDCLFLLSWTLTQDAKQAAACGLDDPRAVPILQLADTANAALAGTLETWAGDGSITAQTLPNLIYVDANDTFSLNAALGLNARFNGLRI